MLLHDRDGPVVDATGGLRRQRAVQAHDVGPAEQLVERGGPPVPQRVLDSRREIGVVKRHLHPERAGAGGDREPDPAEADDAEDLTPHPAHGGHRQLGGAPGVVAPEQAIVVGGGAPGEGEKQSEGVVGHLESAVVGGVAHGDAAPRARLDVDVVEADPGLDDHPCAAHLGHQVRRQPVAAPAVDDRVDLAEGPRRHLSGAGAHDVEGDALPRHLALDVRVVIELRIDDEDADHDVPLRVRTGRAMSTPISASASSIASRITSMSLSTRSPMTPMRNVPVAVRRPGKITMSRRSRAS